jgi:hypothetical protein
MAESQSLQTEGDSDHEALITAISERRIEITRRKIHEISVQMRATIYEADSGVQALELLLEGKRSPTFAVEKLKEFLADAKRKLEALKKAYDKLERALPDENAGTLLENQD